MMDSFWSLWITVLTIVVIVGCFILLRMVSKNTTGVEEGKSMGHSFDGIEEINNPLPKWWSYMFYLTIVFGVIYLVLYPGLGNYKGLLGWSSADMGHEYDGIRELNNPLPKWWTYMFFASFVFAII